MISKLTIGLLCISLVVACDREGMDGPTATCTDELINTSYSQAGALQQVMDKYTKKGLPGVAVTVYSDEGLWEGASGYSKVETHALMQPCNLQYAQSVSKTYMATAILKLYEEGRIDLNEKITSYLPPGITENVTGADQMTVRMLLNHTSGVAEYNDVPAYVVYVIQHPLHEFTTADYLNFIKGKPTKFSPGTKYLYTNTNYELLALIGDQITGDHARFIRDSLLAPLGLTNTFYHENATYLDKPSLVNSYWDRYSNGVIENCTQMEKVNVGSLIGDDGMIATPSDYVRFLKALMDGDILSSTTMAQMLTFVRNDTIDPYGYGLGIHVDQLNGHLEFGHTGGGIGGGCELGYFPDSKTYFFIAINIGTSINSPILDAVSDMQDEIYQILAP